MYSAPANYPIGTPTNQNPLRRPAQPLPPHHPLAQVDNLIVASFTNKNGEIKTLPPAVKRIKTQIQQNQIRTGAIVDLAEVEDMPSSSRTEMMSRLLKIMPQLRGKPVYIGIAGKLSIKDGQPQFAPDSKLQIGKLELPLNDFAKQLGVSRSALAENMTNYLQFRNLEIERIDLTDQGAIVTGNKK
jgi:hypothetical protein